jgi:hypothetical protein
LLKLDKNGILQWDSILPFVIGEYFVNLIDYIPSTDEYIFFSHSYSDTLHITKVNRNMQRIWDVKYYDRGTDGNTDIQIKQVIKDIKGYVAVGLYKRAVPIYGGSAWVLKLDDFGNKVWEAFYDSTVSKNPSFPHYVSGNGASFYSIDTMPNGGYILGGQAIDSMGHQSGCIMRIDSNGCLTDTLCEGHTISGIANIPYTDIHLYPNPAHNVIYVETIVTKSQTVHITDLLGREYSTEQLQEPQTIIDCHAWARGIYIWSIESQGLIIKTGKLVVE